MPNEDLKTAADVATELKNDLSDCFEQLGESVEVPMGNTNHGTNYTCCGYFTDINRILQSYSHSAVRDAEKFVQIDSQLSSLDEALETRM